MQEDENEDEDENNDSVESEEEGQINDDFLDLPFDSLKEINQC